MLTAPAAGSTLLWLSSLLALVWLGQAIAALRGIPQLPDLTRIDPATLPQLPDGTSPHLSVVVPACNEEPSIQATLRSLLASTGLRLQIIAVNDRSTDRTGPLMDEVAAEAASSRSPHTLQIIHNTELPPGWLGKPHAMALAVERSTAPWILFTDGDGLFHPQALELSLRHALAQRADHLVLLPTLILRSIGEASVLGAMSILAQWTIRIWKVSDPRAKDFAGSGSFNLVRREALHSIGGLDALRMQVIEDLTLGWLVKKAGFRQRAAIGPGLIRIRWIQGTFGIVSLAEKNAFAVYRYRVWLTLLASLGLAYLIVLPFVALAAGGWNTVSGLFIYLFIFLVYVAGRRANQVAPWLAIFFAPAAAIVLYATLRSMVLTLARNGVRWRGTLYPLKDLRRQAALGK